MPFKVIAGTFQVVNYSPDGDSIRFHPDNPVQFDDLAGPPARFNGRGDVQLRIEAIDTTGARLRRTSMSGSACSPVGPGGMLMESSSGASRPERMGAREQGARPSL